MRDDRQNRTKRILDIAIRTKGRTLGPELFCARPAVPPPSRSKMDPSFLVSKLQKKRYRPESGRGMGSTARLWSEGGGTGRGPGGTSAPPRGSGWSRRARRRGAPPGWRRRRRRRCGRPSWRRGPWNGVVGGRHHRGASEGCDGLPRGNLEISLKLFAFRAFFRIFCCSGEILDTWSSIVVTKHRRFLFWLFGHDHRTHAPWSIGHIDAPLDLSIH